MIVNKNILLISPEPWNHIFVSKHHYATHLAKRANKVFFLNPPKEHYSIKDTDYTDVFSVEYQSFPKGLRFYPRFLKRYLVKKKYERLERLCDVKFDIVWSFDNSVFYNFESLPTRILKISHLVDLNQDFNTAEAASGADICLCSSEVIKKYISKHGVVAHNIGHGFNSIETKIEEKKISLPGVNPVKCFYAGNLNIKYIDWTLIQKLISSYPQIDFVFAGNWTDEKAKNLLINKLNFFYLGILKSYELPSYYLASDILLISYLYDSFPDQLSNPHKMIEYLGSGKVIAATKTLEYQDMANENLIAMANENEEFPVLFEKVINNLRDWNSDVKRKKRIDMALNNTYDKQIDRIEHFAKSIFK